MVRTPDLGVHVHVCTAGSDWERRQLLFRDWLRYDQSDRAAYNSLTGWTVLDGQIDSALTALRASQPDLATEKPALTTLLTSLQ